jgi:hypothetical protein
VEDWARDGTDRAANKWNAWSLPAPDPGPGAARPVGGAPAALGSGIAPTPGTPERSAPDANGVVRTKTGWRKLLPGGGHGEHGR